MKQSIVKSYGAMTTILSYLDPSCQTSLQALDKWMYKTAVSRVQRSIQLSKFHWFVL